jgi:hypothetical protein
MLNMNWGAIPDLAYSVPATSNEALRTLCARLVAQLQPVNRAMLDKAIAAVDDPGRNQLRRDRRLDHCTVASDRECAL